MIIDLYRNSPSLKPDSKVCFDANVLIYLFAPTSRPAGQLESKYSNLLSKIRKSSADIVIDPTVISEYVNTCLRIEYRAKLKTERLEDAGLKRFRLDHGGWYDGIAKEVSDHLREILALPNLGLVDTSVGALDMPLLIDEFETDRRDWNDQIIAELCRKNGYLLVTHDGDFKQEQDLTILTYNGRLAGTLQ